MSVFKDTPADALLVMVTVVTAALPFGMALGLSWWWGFAFVVLANVHLNASMHYHIHRPLFNSPRLNRWYELVCVLPCLVGFQEYKHIHLEHHKYVNDAPVGGMVGDPVSTYRWGKGGAEEPMVSYALKGVFRNVFMGDNLRPTARVMDRQKYTHELWVKGIVLVAVLAANPAFFPLYLGLLYAAWTLNWLLSYCEHHGAADPTDERRDSVSCYNRVYNFLLFNTGYHQEHHYRPGMHWTKLPALREQLPADRVVTRYTLFDNNQFSRQGAL